MPAKKLTLSPSAEKETFILRYMATLADDAEMEIARMATTMAGPLGKTDPSSLVAMAIQIREVAAIALPAHRAGLLRNTDRASLNALYHHIGEGKTDAQQRKHPHMNSIIEAMRRQTQEETTAWQKDPERDVEKVAVEKILTAVEAASGPRPVLPCPTLSYPVPCNKPSAGALAPLAPCHGPCWKRPSLISSQS